MRCPHCNGRITSERICPYCKNDLTELRVTNDKAKLGAIVYFPSLFKNRVEKGEVIEIKISKFGVDVTILVGERKARRAIDTVFSTEEEAQKALKDE